MMKRAHDQTKLVFRNSEAHREVGGLTGRYRHPSRSARTTEASRLTRESGTASARPWF
jgi:hypothetical protein